MDAMSNLSMMGFVTGAVVGGLGGAFLAGPVTAGIGAVLIGFIVAVVFSGKAA